MKVYSTVEFYALVTANNNILAFCIELKLFFNKKGFYGQGRVRVAGMFQLKERTWLQLMTLLKTKQRNLLYPFGGFPQTSIYSP